MAGIETRGMDELLAMLEGMGPAAKKVQDKVLIKAAQPILDDMSSNAPERTGKGKRLLKIGRPETKSGSRSVIIGIDKADISEVFYLKFSEWGTSRQPAIPFMQPAKEKNLSRVKEIMQEELRRGLGL